MGERRWWVGLMGVTAGALLVFAPGGCTTSGRRPTATVTVTPVPGPPTSTSVFTATATTHPCKDMGTKHLWVSDAGTLSGGQINSLLGVVYTGLSQGGVWQPAITIPIAGSGRGIAFVPSTKRLFLCYNPSLADARMRVIGAENCLLPATVITDIALPEPVGGHPGGQVEVDAPNNKVYVSYGTSSFNGGVTSFTLAGSFSGVCAGWIARAIVMRSGYLFDSGLGLIINPCSGSPNQTSCLSTGAWADRGPAGIPVWTNTSSGVLELFQGNCSAPIATASPVTGEAFQALYVPPLNAVFASHVPTGNVYRFNLTGGGVQVIPLPSGAGTRTPHGLTFDYTMNTFPDVYCVYSDGSGNTSSQIFRIDTSNNSTSFAQLIPGMPNGFGISFGQL